MKTTWIKLVLLLSAIYDGVIGISFFAAGPALFHAFHVTPPNHFGYVRFPALMLLIFGAMFLRAAADPVGRRDVLLYGAALKLSYFSLVFWYELRRGIPGMWIPFAWADVVFFALFVAGWLVVSKQSKPAYASMVR